MQRLGVFIFGNRGGPKQRSTVGGDGDEIRIRDDDEPNRISCFMLAKGYCFRCERNHYRTRDMMTDQPTPPIVPPSEKRYHFRPYKGKPNG